MHGHGKQLWQEKQTKVHGWVIYTYSAYVLKSAETAWPDWCLLLLKNVTDKKNANQFKDKKNQMIQIGKKNTFLSGLYHEGQGSKATPIPTPHLSPVFGSFPCWLLHAFLLPEFTASLHTNYPLFSPSSSQNSCTKCKSHVCYQPRTSIFTSETTSSFLLISWLKFNPHT